jgi:hypothetical protein
MQDGAELELPAHGRGWEDHIRKLCRAIEARMAVHGRAALPSAESVLHRRSSYPDWLTRLRGLLTVAQHRSRAVSVDDMWRVLESPASPAWARAAAAVAIAPAVSPAERMRIRRVAEQTASPALQDALTAVREGGRRRRRARESAHRAR